MVNRFLWKNIKFAKKKYMSMKTRWILLFSVALVAICGCNKKESYTVSFDSNGGEGVMNPQVFTEGQQQALSKNAFTREGYLFSEWCQILGRTIDFCTFGYDTLCDMDTGYNPS